MKRLSSCLRMSSDQGNMSGGWWRPDRKLLLAVGRFSTRDLSVWSRWSTCSQGEETRSSTRKTGRCDQVYHLVVAIVGGPFITAAQSLFLGWCCGCVERCMGHWDDWHGGEVNGSLVMR
jgi:hypothetical protein